MTSRSRPIRIELFVRSLAPNATRPTQESVFERLQRLAATGTIELSVHVTGGRVCPNTAAASTETGQFLLDSIDAFESWADEHGRSLRPCFEYHENATAIDGSDCSGIEFPTMVLAEYDAAGLRFVAPSSDGTSTVTVRDRLEAIEREAPTDDDAVAAVSE
jgi:DNA-binding HxlR family transcriptional regulator